MNEDKLETDGHLPILKFDSMEELQAFKDGFSGSMEISWNEIPSFEDATKGMDAAYFRSNTLFVIHIRATSGSYRYGARDISVDGGSLCVQIEQTNHPEYGTADMMNWFMVVTVPKSKTADCLVFDAVMV